MGIPPRPHPLARSQRVDQANRFFAHAWDKGWLPPPLLDADALWESAAKPLADNAKAAEEAGRPPDDVVDFRERLSHLVNAVGSEANLNPLGRVMAHGQLERVIRNRLRMGAVWLDRPGMPETNIAPPIIIVGHMRSGTTRIHKLLAADPAHSSTRYCDAFHPVPGKIVDLREWKASFEIGFLSALNPWLQSIHPIASTEVEEELGWLAGALQHSIYESQWHIPSYSAWSEPRDASPVYREFARVLKTDAAHRGLAEKPRVLKVPVFSENLPELLEQFPDVRLLVAERDLEAVHRSAVSLVANQMAVQSDACDLPEIEGQWHRKIKLREDRRKAFLKDWHGPVSHLHFDELNTDWEGTISRAYRELDMPLTDRAKQAMRRVMARSKSGQHRSHSEQLRGFHSPAN